MLHLQHTSISILYIYSLMKRQHTIMRWSLTSIWTGKSNKKHYAMLRFSFSPIPVLALESNGSFIQTSIYVQEWSLKRSREALIPLAWKLIRENNWMPCRFPDIRVRAACFMTECMSANLTWTRQNGQPSDLNCDSGMF